MSCVHQKSLDTAQAFITAFENRDHQYDERGRLAQVWDPCVANPLKITSPREGVVERVAHASHARLDSRLE